jgi:hypothetical protein
VILDDEIAVAFTNAGVAGGSPSSSVPNNSSQAVIENPITATRAIMPRNLIVFRIKTSLILVSSD